MARNQDKKCLSKGACRSKITCKIKDYDFIPIIPSDAKVGNNKINFEIPYDATGNITIFLGKNNFTIDVSNTTETLIDGFVEGNNFIKILNREKTRKCVNHQQILICKTKQKVKIG